MRRIDRALLGLVPFVLAATLDACVAPPDDTGQVDQGLTVCHSTTVPGIDVSEFQGTINWASVAGSGVKFAIARIGDGTYMDSQFARNWSGIRANGMIRGAYLFFRPTVSASAQASMISAAVGTLGAGDLPVTIDVECMCPYMPSGACSSSTAGCASASSAISVLQDLANRVETSTGKRPIIYTGAWFWDGSGYFNNQANFGSYPLWVSGYITGCVTVPTGWTDWQFWQYTDSAPTPGITTQNPDGDKFNGTLADLQNFANGTSSPVWGGTFVSQSFPYASVGTVMIHAGQSASATLTMRNSGTTTWDMNTRIGTTQPRDRTSPFADSTWIGPDRPASVPSGMHIAPGGTYAFQWTWSVPATMAPGMYTEYYGMVEDGTTWFSASGEGGPPDNQLEAIIEVLPAVSPSDGGVVTDAGGNDAGGNDAGRTDAGGNDASARDATSDVVANDSGTQRDAGDVVTSGDATARDAVGDSEGSNGMTHGGCGCRVGGGATHDRALSLGAMFALGAIATWRRRKKRACFTGASTRRQR